MSEFLMKNKTPFLVKFAILTTITVIVSVFLQIMTTLRKTPDIEISPETIQSFEFNIDEQFIVDYQNRPGL